MNFESYLLAFIPLFVAVDALGIVPFYLSLTRGLRDYEKNKILRRSILTALWVAVIFLGVGKLIFSWLGITIADFLVAGGAILFILSIRDLLSSEPKSRVPSQTMGVVPLAVPLIVGPAVLTSSLILADTMGVYPTLFAIVSNILLAWVILHRSQAIAKVLGETGSHTISKIFNLLLAAIGIMLIRRGLLEILSSKIS